MPRGDGTGPQGNGPRTGRGCGPCGWGFGFHHGPWCGFWHHGPYSRRQWTPKEEKEVLEDEVKNLEEELTAIKERLAELK
jgi:hypothetical protein